MKIKEIKSTDKNVVKYIFETESSIAEAVLYKYNTFNERTVICCSTQSGCPVGCRFCGTGNYFVRNFRSEEIVFQVYYLLNHNKINAKEIEKFQIMVMSMGEPMLNYKELKKAFIILNEKYPNAKLLISTIAPNVNYEDLLNLSADITNIGLQFSIHESTDEDRNKLIPFKDKLTLKQISELGIKFFEKTGRKPFINYCANIHNSTKEDAKRLSELFNPNIFEATISVICEIDESIAAANKRQEELAFNFMSNLLELGYSTRMFNPAGQDDIGGGCGQLWFVQDWFEKNPNLVKKTIGFGKEQIHTPIY